MVRPLAVVEDVELLWARTQGERAFYASPAYWTHGLLGERSFEVDRPYRVNSLNMAWVSGLLWAFVKNTRDTVARLKCLEWDELCELLQECVGKKVSDA